MREWVIELPWSAPPVKPNGGYGNRYAHAAKVKQVRQAGGLLARDAEIPELARCQVLLEWHVGDRTKRDADNLVMLLKVLCDSISGGRAAKKVATDWNVVPDDAPEWMDKLMPRVVYVKGQPKRMTFTVREIP